MEEEEESKKKVVRVPRKKLQSVPDLLTNGDESSSSTESTVSKLLWMAFLVIMFYISFEIFLRFRRVRDSNNESGGSTEF